MKTNADVPALLQQYAGALKTRSHEAHKGTYGRLLILAGSPGMAGAAYLAGLAAFRCGIGMVKYLGPECNRPVLQTLLPEAMYESLPETAGGCSLETYRERLMESISWGDYMILGPGLSRSAEAKRLVRTLFTPAAGEILRQKKLIIVDADALNIMAEHGLDPGRLGPAAVITPHIVEMSRLCGISPKKTEERQNEIAAEYAKAHGVAVVLKSARTAVSAGDDFWLLDSGCGAMAKAGSGDVLCGFIAGITAVAAAAAETVKTNTDEAGPDKAAVPLAENSLAMKEILGDTLPLAVHLHGRAGCIAAGHKGEHSILARDIAEAAGEALAEAAE